VGGEPHLEVESDTHDFGTIFQMRTYKAVFKLRNSGTADLRIDRVSAPCGCTAALLSDKRIKPGGEAEVEVTFKSGMYSRPTRKAIRVLSNDPETPQKKLYIKAAVLPRVVLDQKSLPFKEVYYREGATQSVTIKPSENEEIRSLKVAFTSPAFRGDIEQVSVVENSFAVNVSVLKDLPIGKASGDMRFYINGESEPCARLQVYAWIVGDIKVSPIRLVFRRKPGSDKEIKPITLTNKASEPLEILSVETDVEGLQVAASPVEEGKEYAIVAKLAPNVRPGTMKGNITVRTNNADHSEIIIPVRGTVQ
jgi:hypothetical protein